MREGDLIWNHDEESGNMKGFSGRKFSQRQDEFKQFLRILLLEKARSYLEIGARDGDSFHAVMSALPKGSRGVAIDLPEARWGRRDSRHWLERAIADLNRRDYHCCVHFGDSAAAAAIAFAKERAPFDALLIDGDHTLDAVTKDWQNYGPMARLVAFHDIDGHDHWAEAGERLDVPELWTSLRPNYRTTEIIGSKRGMGIGVLWR
jgi:hypothetical protein